MEIEDFIIGALKSSPLIKRYYANPIMSARDIPYQFLLIYNPGVVKLHGKYVMVYNNDYGSLEDKRIDGTNIGLAFSDDGIKWQVQPEPCFELINQEILRVYDPRLTVIDGHCFMCFGVHTRHGIRGGIAVTEDFERFEVLSLSTPDNRNMVLFPEKINNIFVRLERPFPVYGRDGMERFDIWISDSPDLKYWGNSDLLLAVKDVPFSNLKIGPAAPPVKTQKGWLTTFHTANFDPARRENGEPRPGDAIYDHPTPLSQKGTLVRLLESLKIIEFYVKKEAIGILYFSLFS